MEWLVVASGAHTLNLPPIMQRYPTAKVVGPPQAEAKLRFIKAIPWGKNEKFDYDSTDATQLASVNAILEPEGVQLHDVAGDVVTNALG